MKPTCATNCLYDLPGVNYNNCGPEVFASQLRRLFIGKLNAQPFTNWKLLAEWQTRVNQSSTVGNDYIRALTVTGEKPAPGNVTKKIDNGITAQVGKDHTIPFTTYQVTDENYEFMRATECGIQVRLFAYETMGGVFFGSNEGQIVTIVMDDVLPGGDDDLENLTGNLTWRSKFSFERLKVSPVFDIDFNLGGSVPSTFDTIQTFASATSATDAGVTTLVGATDPDLKFEFNEVTPRPGLPITMVLKSGSTEIASIDATTDYTGDAWRFTDASGAVFTGVFADGDVALS